MGILISLAVFAALITVLVDIILLDDSRIKHLGKTTWVFVVILLPLIGGILWFSIGRESAAPTDYRSFGSPERRENLASFDESSTEAQLAKLDAEIEFFEQQDRIRRLEEQLRDRKRLQ